MTAGLRLISSVLAFGLLTNAQRDGSPAPQPPQGAIAGVVRTTGEGGVPVRRALVSLVGGEQTVGRSVVTDDEGRFAFLNLSPGRYRISAWRAGFVTVPFGAKQPLGPAARLILERGQRIDDVSLLLAPGAVITGRVADELNRPIPEIDVRVEAIDADARFTVRTDDEGRYRAFGLPPGHFIVSARPRVTGEGPIVPRSTTEVDALLATLHRRDFRGAVLKGSEQFPASQPQPEQTADFALIFHPASFAAEDAQPVLAVAGQERTGVDIVMRMIPVARVSGTIRGVVPSQAELSLSRFNGKAASTSRAAIGPGGAFQFSSVSPGTYLLALRDVSGGMRALVGLPSDAPSDGHCVAATAVLRITGADATGVDLEARPCTRITGRVIFQAAEASPTPATGIVVSLVPAARTIRPSSAPLIRSVLGSDGRFVWGDKAEVLPGSYYLTIELPAAARTRQWTVVSAAYNGRDALDREIEITPDDLNGSSLNIVIADQRASLSGQLQVPSQASPREYAVVLVPTDRQWWAPPFRRIRMERPSPTGEFLFDDVVPGEYHMAVIDDVPQAWRTTVFMEQLVDQSIRVLVRKGEQARQSLRVAR